MSFYVQSNLLVLNRKSEKITKIQIFLWIQIWLQRNQLYFTKIFNLTIRAGNF